MQQGITDDKLHWYKDAVLYEVHIKAFRDGNGDGIGDFKGLLQKLDYLQDLGVTAIWILPFYPSPLRDDGYDIADYYNVNPAYGTLADFQEFLDEAHNRNLKVITELVINHTSDQHPWFQRARKEPIGSPLRDFYVWTDDANKYRDVRIIFQDTETSNWTWDPVAGQYYWHRFFHHQPDLNFDNPLVQAEIFKILDFWCSMGVDGFRLDAVPYLFEREGTNGENLPETHVFLKKLRKHVDDHYPGTMLLAEANMWPEDAASYFGDGDECHMNYHFPVMPRMYMALQMEDRYPLTDIFDQTPEIPANCQWAIFLRNHDELTLEMVTDEERDYMYKAYVKDPRARINLGIRHRLAPLMSNNRQKIELLNYLLFSLPGTPVLYYGDEIGMGDNYYLGDRDGVRTPMQWSSDRNAGFSEAHPHKLYLPIILDPEYHYESVNVDMQSRNTSSLLWWMKRVLSKRKQYKALGRGDLKFVSVENAKILAFTRTYEEETVLVIVNLSRYTQAAELNLDSFAGYVPVEVFSQNRFPSIKENNPYFFTLAAYDCEWFVLHKVESMLTENKTLPVLNIAQWDKFAQRAVVTELENYILPIYLRKLRWFGGKSRIVESIKIIDHATVPLTAAKTTAYILLLEINYASGLSDTYQLPIAFGEDAFANKLKENCPQSVIAQVRTSEGTEGILYDAIYGLAFQEEIFLKMSRQERVKVAHGELLFTGNEALAAHVQQQEKIKPKVLGGEQSNTSITFDNKFFLKLFRKVDRSINPDVEITHFLTEHTNFTHVPGFIGTIEWKSASGSIVLGMMQQMVESSTDTWSYMLDRLDHFNERILTHTDIVEPPPPMGTLLRPVTYDHIPAVMKDLLESVVADNAALLGKRTSEMHLALLSRPDIPDFRFEEYSLHYQRSLFSGLQSLVRSTFQNLSRSLDKLDPEVRQEAEDVLAMKGEILQVLKRIYKNKIDVVKIRIHGDYHLGQVLYTGKDFILTDFEGEPARSYSERRLKRSPLRDVAGIIRSFHYAAYASLFLDNQIRKEDFPRLIPYVEQWYHYMSSFFMDAYLKYSQGAAFIPQNNESFEIMMTTFLLEKAIYEVNYELNNRPDWVIIPLRGIKMLMKKNEAEAEPTKIEDVDKHPIEL
ncbi:maltose alpha-D-glucosyltransferase [Parachryseolinea silvisoli]|uniref:maltose alpha-D-glucosyltransferase n=1 Tax=Parachryseolinea silvisoli TaxID=2873601 RepID=UPI002265CEBB|nr:maltose alpha-D-glucosyltransferase [Parachryseolinea silvisoli]MCD9018262.1 maltose alpha-D-glucosyltransferase [Parachryseolinea silvisoli]